jgi:alpha-tubulin suppressor-like RCC1 family protein
VKRPVPMALAAALVAVVSVPGAYGEAGGLTVAWGSSNFGQITVPAEAQSGVTAVAGFNHSVALKADGSVVAWGAGATDTGIGVEHGQAIVPAAAQSGVIAIAAGWFHTLALKTNGTVIAWGGNSYGQGNVPLAAQSGVVAIAAGEGHSLAVKADGSLVAWGDNSHGQATVPAAAQSRVSAVAAGYKHSVTLKANGSVVSWGWNFYGQTDVPLEAKSGVKAIAAGYGHTVALKEDGSVVAWGDNIQGQVTGVPVTGEPYSARALPVTLQGKPLSDILAIAAGADHTVALKADGTVIAWGDGGFRQTTPPDGLMAVTAIAAGGAHSMAVFTGSAPTIVVQPASLSLAVCDTAVMSVRATGYPSTYKYQWRKNGRDLVDANSDTYRLALTRTNQSGGLYTVVVSNSAGSVTSAPPALLTVTQAPPAIQAQPESRSVHAWQSVNLSVLATGCPLAMQWRKDGVDVLGATNATLTFSFTQQRDAGAYTLTLSNSAGVTTSAPAIVQVNPTAIGTVVAWGYDVWGQSTTPVAAQSGVIAITAGWSHGAALRNDGSVVTWENSSRAGTPLAAQSGVRAIVAARLPDNSCPMCNSSARMTALTREGAVVIWGDASDSQLPVPAAAQSGITAVAAGAYHTLALTMGGSVISWGNAGQMAVPAAAEHAVIAIAAGELHSLALTLQGSVVAWGSNDYGQATVPVLAQRDVVAIAAGQLHSLALKSDGSVVAWGFNDFGQSVVPPEAQSGVMAIAAGYGHSVALKTDGSVLVWGEGAMPPAGLKGVTAIAAGGFHTYALVGGGQAIPLSARRSGDQLLLFWTAAVPGFRLQTTSRLTNPVEWLDATNSPAVIGSQIVLPMTMSGSAQFFQLRKL